jgi:mannonate dehydratase
MLCYTHASGATLDDTMAAVQSHVDSGYKAIRIQCGVPGLKRIYGVHGDEHRSDQHEQRPAEGDWDTAAYLRFAPKIFEGARKRFGEELHFLHDAHHRLLPIEAAQLGKSLEPYSLFWMEDATPAENQENFRLIRRHTTTKLAVGEVFNSLWDCQALISEQLIDFIRATIVHAGGITHVRRIADFASLYGVRTGFHGAADLSPVTMGAALHFGRWVPNFGIQEYALHPPEASNVFRWDWSLREGMLHSGESPGIGVEINEEAAAKYPYRRAYLDVNRLTDGTLWNW